MAESVDKKKVNFVIFWFKSTKRYTDHSSLFVFFEFGSSWYKNTPLVEYTVTKYLNNFVQSVIIERRFLSSVVAETVKVQATKSCG